MPDEEIFNDKGSVMLILNTSLVIKDINLISIGFTRTILLEIVPI